jgi:two-component system, OmpR family, sensor kinase
VSFRTRLVLAAAYLVTAVVLALEIPLALNIQRRLESEFRSAVLGNAAVLAAQVADDVGQGGAGAPARLGAQARETAQRTGERVVVTDRRGRVLADSTGAAAPGTLYATDARPEFSNALFEGRIDFRRRFSDTLEQELELVTVPVLDGGRVVGAVRMSAPTGEVAANVRESWLRLALIGLAVIAAALVLAWFLADSMARPLQRLARTARDLGHGDLDARAPEKGPRELREVGQAFNGMARALAANLRAQRDLLANASHQLRTPLTGLRLRLEALAEEPGPAGRQAEKAEAELDRLSALVDDLLELASASSVEETGRTVDLAEAARAAVERWKEPAEQAERHIALGRDTSAMVWSSVADLGHILDNLIENALRYCPPGTEVTVEATRSDGAASLIVSDTGPGIPVEDRERIFERFYRGANGRRAGPGTGLGLAIVAEVATRWGAEVRLLEGDGTRVEARFPVSPTVS